MLKRPKYLISLAKIFVDVACDRFLFASSSDFFLSSSRTGESPFVACPRAGGALRWVSIGGVWITD
jgi:hypothetical protein